METPVPAGTVDFMTIARSCAGGSASMTARTADRSASPEYVEGVPTATKASRAASTAGASSVEKRRRSRTASTSSGSPGSKIGMSPASRRATFSASTSTQWTSDPSSANPAAVTRPT